MYPTQILKITTGNPATVNDAAIASTVTGAPTNIGQLGAIYHLDKATADRLGLKPGFLQYVQVKSDATAAPAEGLVAIWSDRASFVVVPDVTAATAGNFAGIFLGAITKGNYGFIYVAGVCKVKGKASITKTTPAAGDLVVIDQAPGNTGDVLADATGLTSVTSKSVIGVSQEAMANGALKLVAIQWRNVNIP